MIRRVLSLVLAILIAFVGVVGLLLFLQSRDQGSLDRPATTRTITVTTPRTATSP